MAVTSVKTVAILKTTATKNQAEVFCEEMRTSYQFFTVGTGFTVNGTSVISSNLNPSYRWVGVSGRHVYSASVQGPQTLVLKPRESNLPGLTVQQLVDRQAIEGTTLWCSEFKTTYKYFENADGLEVDGTSVLQSTVSGSGRWVAQGGSYQFSSVVPRYNSPLDPVSTGGGGGGGSSQVINPVIVLYQEFPKDSGYSNSYSITGAGNATVSPSFNIANIDTSKPVQVVFDSGKPVYDNFFPRTKSHIITATIGAGGVVTLSATPYSGYSAPIRIYFFYNLQTLDSVTNYRRDDIVTDLEQKYFDLFAEDIEIEDANSRFTATDVEGALDEIKAIVDNTLVPRAIPALANPPTSGSDKMYFDTEYRCLMIYDSARGKWLSDNEIYVMAGRSGNSAAGTSLRVEPDTPTSASPVVLSKDVCLVGISGSTAGNERFVLRIDDVSAGGSGTQATINYEAAGPATTSSYINTDLNHDFNENDALDVYVLSTNSGLIAYPFFRLIFRARK